MTIWTLSLGVLGQLIEESRGIKVLTVCVDFSSLPGKKYISFGGDDESGRMTASGLQSITDVNRRNLLNP